MNSKKVIAVLPAYNAAKTLKLTLDDIPAGSVDEIILVDDASSDNTVELAKQYGLHVFVHEKNKGYGGNQKTCYKKALEMGADIAIMIHPDHQYNPKLVPQMLAPLLNEECDAVFGSRMIHKRDALEGGMPKYKFVANIILTKIENFILGLTLAEYHSGFRAYSKKALSMLPLQENSDDFVFDTEIIAQLAINKFKIKEIPINTKYFKDASNISLKRSTEYGLGILKTMVKYKLHQWGIKKIKQLSSVNNPANE
jgi:glycosyltransferase involved in cell wall biosynthesis